MRQRFAAKILNVDLSYRLDSRSNCNRLKGNHYIQYGQFPTYYIHNLDKKQGGGIEIRLV